MTDCELVLRGGRVIDPETGLDEVRAVAVADGRVAAVAAGLPSGALPSGALPSGSLPSGSLPSGALPSGALPSGTADIDVSRQVVTAGFIDLHSHVTDLGGLRLQAMDGVTTALELEAGVTPVAEAYRRAGAQGRPVNYGFSASWALARMEAVAGMPPDASLGGLLGRISDPAWLRAVGQTDAWRAPADPGRAPLAVVIRTP